MFEARLILLIDQIDNVYFLIGVIYFYRYIPAMGRSAGNKHNIPNLKEKRPVDQVFCFFFFAAGNNTLFRISR